MGIEKYAKFWFLKGANVNAPPSYFSEDTSLIIASKRQRTKLVKFLFSKYASIVRISFQTGGFGV